MRLGDLTPAMIGTQRVRIRWAGTEITGTLTALRVHTEPGNTTGFHAPDPVTSVWVGIRVGKTWVNDHRIGHPIALLEDET